MSFSCFCLIRISNACSLNSGLVSKQQRLLVGGGMGVVGIFIGPMGGSCSRQGRHAASKGSHCHQQLIIITIWEGLSHVGT